MANTTLVFSSHYINIVKFITKISIIPRMQFKD